MKWAVFLLFAANIAFGGYVWMREHAPNPDAQRVRMQVNAEQLRIIPTPERPAGTALRDPPVTSAAPVATASTCMEWGSFGGGELVRAQRAIDRLTLGHRVRKMEIAATVGYWVYIPPMKTRAEMEHKAVELKDMGIVDYYPVMDANRWRYAISLGIFRSEEGARRYLTTLRAKGVRSAITGKRDQRVNQAAFLIRNPSDEESANLAVLKSEFPGSELRPLECPVS